MTEKERARAQCAAVITEMFLGLGSEATPERLGYFLELLAGIEPRLLKAACNAAVLALDNSFPPSPGQIYRQAKRIRAETRVREREQQHRLEMAALRKKVLGEHAGK